MAGFPEQPSGRRTLLAICAHPDDETLLIGGTLAKAAAAGHRVVVLLATDGARGLTGTADDLAARRAAELAAATTALGVSDVVRLQYGDSGFHEPELPPTGSLAAAPLAEVQQRLCDVLSEFRPDVVLLHDGRGGYGHRDHVVCHRAGLGAARVLGVGTVLEATLPSERLSHAVKVLNAVGIRPGGVQARDVMGWYTPDERITHQVDVRRHVAAKRRAMGAHTSQMTGGADVRTLALLARLPALVARWVLGTEWYVESDATPGRSRAVDVFGSVDPAR